MIKIKNNHNVGLLHFIKRRFAQLLIGNIFVALLLSGGKLASDDQENNPHDRPIIDIQSQSLESLRTHETINNLPQSELSISMHYKGKTYITLHPTSSDIIRILTGQMDPTRAPQRYRAVNIGQNKPKTPTTNKGPDLPKISIHIPFDYNSSALTYRSRQILRELGEALVSQDLEPFRFLIVGHTDAKGGLSYNQILSEKRAKSVKHYLTKRFNIDFARMITSGLGEYDLLTPQKPYDRINRRVEITNIGYINRELDNRKNHKK